MKTETVLDVKLPKVRDIFGYDADDICLLGTRWLKDNFESLNLPYIPPSHRIMDWPANKWIIGHGYYGKIEGKFASMPTYFEVSRTYQTPLVWLRTPYTNAGPGGGRNVNNTYRTTIGLHITNPSTDVDPIRESFKNCMNCMWILSKHTVTMEEIEETLMACRFLLRALEPFLPYPLNPYDKEFAYKCPH